MLLVLLFVFLFSLFVLLLSFLSFLFLLSRLWNAIGILLLLVVVVMLLLSSVFACCCCCSCCCCYSTRTTFKTRHRQARIACSAYAPSANFNNPESGVKFSTASLAKSTKKAPSTNRPIVCPACHPNLADDAHKLASMTATRKRKSNIRPAIWSYNMKAHWHHLHASTAMSAGLEEALKVTCDEKDALKSL